MRTLLRWLGALVLLAGVAAAGIGWMLFQRLQQPYRGYADAEQFVEIPAGIGTTGIGQRLVDAGVVSDTLTFRLAVATSGLAQRLQAGEYRFTDALTPLAVLDTMSRGEVYVRKLTFREGLTIAEMAAVYESKGFGPAAAFAQAASAATLMADLDPEARDLEGYLFPETYTLKRTASAATLVAGMVERFRAVAGPDFLGLAAAQGLTLRQVVSLAALVEKETAREEERPHVAAVYRNRLRIGMPMQADPTLIYALTKAGRYDGNIRKADLTFDSPYNTYRYPGLPPGPIAAPGRASLEAVLHPADVEHLYFVSRNDGSHAFADTLAEHNGNVRRFQVEYFRQKRAAARTAPAGAPSARPTSASRAAGRSSSARRP
ncbi:MAG: endolytic transglycosylase MltG [Vicinamibacterales bacterium]|nr:endolytic transglycosylase MltG [Vicinamibacterales bacterium]